MSAVVRYLRSQGLSVKSVSSNRLLIDAFGTTTQVERAFKVTIDSYMLSGHAVYAPPSNPSVPASLAGMIVSIGGLDNVSLYHSLALERPSTSSARQGHRAADRAADIHPANCAPPMT